MTQIIVSGTRNTRPSKRLTLRLDGLRLSAAKITHRSKNKTTQHQVVRLNHLPTRQEIRLHTAQLQYPGEYEVELVYSGVSADDIERLRIDQLTSTRFSTV